MTLRLLPLALALLTPLLLGSLPAHAQVMQYPNRITITPHGEVVMDVGWPDLDIAGIAVNGWGGSGDNFYAQVLGGSGRVGFRADVASPDPFNIGLFLTTFHSAFSGDIVRIDAEDTRNHPTDAGTFTGNFVHFTTAGSEQFRVDHHGTLVVQGLPGLTGCVRGLRIMGGIVIGVC